MTDRSELDCPSASHSHAEAKLLGVVLDEGGEARVSYLEKAADVPEDFDAEALGVDPGHALRFSAPCHNKGCGQWKDGGCGLGKEILKRLSPVVDVAPACTLRSTCRWFAENGVASCLRCPQVTTRRHKSEAVSRHVHSVPSPAAPAGGETVSP
ncbi:hypothetical protein [Qipengyuania flava]|uniref:hypothetical protein n=1 Tax=Qipengyuania flava TaxID=192812 RepID=UPI001C629069|nr:hypothetical protein [Qipengyuania flava]QYJ07548.1 hypothetical protein KUV82_02150 [Qipengyuania flava]